MNACWFLGRIVLSCRTTSLAALALLLSAAIPFAAAAPLVSVVDPAKPVYGPNDVSAPAAGQVLRLTGPRNGVCSAQVVAVFPPPAPLSAAGIQATLSSLTNGPATLPPDKIQIRYAAKEDHFDIGALDMRPGHTTHRFLDVYYDRLMNAPVAAAASPTSATAVPVWVTASIPKDAQPGLYKGTLEVAGTKVPVELRVSEWVCPKPNDWTTHVGVVPSAECEALHYGVKFWSPEHWALIEKQMDLLGGVGCDDLWIPVADGGYGKGFPIVTFTKKASPAGAAAATTATLPALEPDLANMRRYVELFAKKVGKPEFVLVYLWGDGPRDRSGQSAGTSMYVTANGTMMGGFGVEDQARGFAFLWLDFWNAPGSGNQPFMNRTSDVMSRQNSPSFVEPGPDGPVATVRYEMLREGLQETEARIVIERALVGKTIEGDLATRSRAFLQKMIQVRFLDNQFEGGHAGGNLGKADRMWGLEDYPAWMDSSAALFDMAAEVQRGK